jgi:hypothetical protein
MVLPPKPVEIAFEELLQALPADYHALAFEFPDFVVESPKMKFSEEQFLLIGQFGKSGPGFAGVG